VTLLNVRDLAVAIGRNRPVDGVSFDIDGGETFALVGESGCGKSMTALALMRLLPPVARIAGGAVGFDGGDLLGLSESSMRGIRGGGMAMIFQEPATSLNPVMTIGSQIGEALALHGGGAADARIVELLSAVGIPDPARRAGEYPFQMSGGMKQRAMIAMALAGTPKLLIADEPTTALDVTIQAQVLDLLKELQARQRMAMMLITHDLGVVARMADRVGVMYAGQLVEVAPRRQFFAAPAHPYSRRLFAALPDTAPREGRLATIPGSVPRLDVEFSGCRFADRCAEVMPVCRSMAPAWRDLGAGRQMRCHLEGEVRASAVEVESGAGDERTERGPASLLEVRDLQVHFPIRRGVFQTTVGYVKAVDGISLAVSAGRTVALVGESGCGKTTAGKAILQLIPPTAGQVRLDGRELTGLAARDMQMVFQDPFGSLNPRLRVGDTIAEGMRAQGTTGDIDAMLQQVGLSADMATRYPHEFSGGQRQRIAIARALAVNPRLLVCDEPTSALDVSVQAQILNLLKDLQTSRGLAYLFISHNIAVVGYLAHEVAVMYLGRIVERGTVEEVLQTARHPYTQALLAAVPRIDGIAGGRLLVPGDPPSPANPPPGCHFHPRCPQAMDVCRQAYPGETVLSATHVLRCHLFG
jgi:peptide/nickel transport system ATP-binding protein